MELNNLNKEEEKNKKKERRTKGQYRVVICERAKHTRALVDERPFLFVAIDVRWREHKVH